MMATSPTAASPELARYERLRRFLEQLSDDVYREPPSRLHGSITAQMIGHVLGRWPQPAGARVLDVGCGQGVALELFAAAGLQATGIAMGEDVRVCRERGFDVLEMNMSFLDFPAASFDLVWCRHALEHSVFPLFTLSELHRVLRLGGVLYIEVPAPDTACRHESNRNHYSVLGRRMWHALIQRTGFVEIEAVDLSFRTGLGPDTYFAFLQRKRPVIPEVASVSEPAAAAS